jgi:F-type H+-transporting ATPase subunit b
MLAFSPLSIIVQIVSFCVLWFGLKRLLFDPVVRVLAEREARTSGTMHTAEEIKAAAAASAAEHERRLQEVRRALAADAVAARTETQSTEQQILADARAQASADLVRLRDSLSRQAATARPAIVTAAHDLSGRMLERVVGRPLA